MVRLGVVSGEARCSEWWRMTYILVVPGNDHHQGHRGQNERKRQLE